MKPGRSSTAWLHVVALLTLTVCMTACIETEPADDQAFLEQVRESADSPAVSTAEVGTIPGTTESPDAIPAIEVGTDYLDLGFVATDEVTKSTISVKNVGKAPLIVSDIKTSCGCTQGAIAQKTIPPGGETVINVIVDPKKIAGFESTKTLTVYSNDPQKATTAIQVHAKIKPEFILEPDSLKFGVVEKGDTPTLTAVLRQNSDQPVKLENVQVQGRTADALEVAFEERPKDEWQDPSKQEYVIRATVKPTAPAGPLKANILLQSDLPRVKRHFLPAEGNITAFYSVVPRDGVLLGIVNPGKTVSEAIRVSAAEPFKVVSATAEPAGMTLTPHDTGDGASVGIDVAVSPDVPAGSYKGTASLVIEGAGKQYTEKVPLNAVVQRPGEAPATIGKLGKLPQVLPADHQLKPVVPKPAVTTEGKTIVPAAPQPAPPAAQASPAPSPAAPGATQ